MFNTSKRVRLDLYAIVYIVAKVLAALNYVVHIYRARGRRTRLPTDFTYNCAEANEDGTTAFKGSGSQL